MRAGEPGCSAAQLRCPGVHLLYKGGNAARHIPCNDAGGIVGAAHQQRIQQIDAAQLFARRQQDGAAVLAADRLKLLRQAGGHGDALVQVLAAFQQQQGGHHLGQAGHAALLTGILVQQHLAGDGVDQIDTFLCVGCLDRHCVYSAARQSQRRRQCQRKQPCRRAAADFLKIHGFSLDDKALAC